MRVGSKDVFLYALIEYDNKTLKYSFTLDGVETSQFSVKIQRIDLAEENVKLF